MPKEPPELYGIKISEIARRCCVSLKTAARWKSGTTCPPKSALFILSADLGYFDPVWGGWVLKGGALVSPEGWEITKNDVLACPLLRQQIAVYQAELRAMREAPYDLEDQPEPGAIPAISA